MRSIAIIGGGIAGLTAGYELSRQGWQVSIFERDPDLGGQAGTFTFGGAQLERLYHHIFTNDRHIVGLIDRLGLSPRLQWRDSRTAMFWQGHSYPFATPMDLLRFQPLTFPQRIRLGLVALFLMRYNNWRALEGITAERWVRRYAGDAVYDTIWGPLLRGKFGTSAGDISMTWLWGKLHLRGASRGKTMQKELLGYMDGSFQVMIDALARQIQGSGGSIRRASEVTRIVAGTDEGGQRFTTGIEAGGSLHAFDRVIATVPSFTFLRIAPELPADYGERLSRVKYQSALCAVLEMRESLSPIYWMNIADRRMPFVGLIEHTNFISPQVYGGKRVLYVANYLSQADQLYGMDKDELVDYYLPFLRDVNPRFGPDWVGDRWLFRDDAGQPIITTNYSQHIPDHRTPVRGLYLANTTQIYPEDRGMNYSVRLGQDIARIVAEDAG